MPRGLPEPRTPTVEEKQAHRLTGHMPFAAWMRPAVSKEHAGRRSRLYRLPRARWLERRRALQAEGLGRDRHNVWRDIDGSHAEERELRPLRGRVSLPLVEELGHPRIVTSSDNEPSIRDFVGKVVSVSNAKGDHLQIVHETSPRPSSQSNGSAERAIQTTGGVLRTMKDDIETTVGQRLDATHPVLAWMLRHTGWLHTRFQRHAADGRTSFEKLRLRRYVSPLVACWRKRPLQTP